MTTKLRNNRVQNPKPKPLKIMMSGRQGLRLYSAHWTNTAGVHKGFAFGSKVELDEFLKQLVGVTAPEVIAARPVLIPDHVEVYVKDEIIKSTLRIWGGH